MSYRQTRLICDKNTIVLPHSENLVQSGKDISDLVVAVEQPGPCSDSIDSRIKTSVAHLTASGSLNSVLETVPDQTWLEQICTVVDRKQMARSAPLHSSPISPGMRCKFAGKRHVNIYHRPLLGSTALFGAFALSSLSALLATATRSQHASIKSVTDLFAVAGFSNHNRLAVLPPRRH